MDGWLRKKSSWSLTVIRKATGILFWISEGWAIGQADVVPWIHLRTKGEQILKRKKISDPNSVHVAVSDQARTAIEFWHNHFKSAWSCIEAASIGHVMGKPMFLY